MKLWAMPWSATQDGQLMVESSDKMWFTGEGNGKTLQYSYLENSMNSMKRQKDMTLKDELPRSVGAQYATGHCFFFGSISSFFLELLRHWSPVGIYRPGKFIFQCHIFLPFHTVHGVRKTRILKWFAIPFSSGSHFVRTLHHNPSILGGPTWHGS